MVKRIGEELDKMDEEAEMQRGQSVMPNATPAQRFVTNVVLKALKNIRGITVHHATKADVERMLAQMKAKKTETQGTKEFGLTTDAFAIFDGNEAIEKLRTILEKSGETILPKQVPSLDDFRKLFANPIHTIFNEIVNVKDEVFSKIIRKSRVEISGAVLPTLQEPDFGIRDADGTILYIKRYKNENNEHTYNVAVVNKHGELEDYISSVHIKNDNNILNKIKKGAELLLPKERNTYGNKAQSSSAPTAKIGKNSETTKSEGEIEPLTTSNGTVYGWSVGNEIWLTDEGLNPETPIHEFLHLFVKAMAQENSKEWQRVVELGKKANAMERGGE